MLRRTSKENLLRMDTSKYLDSAVMRATSDTMAVASTVLGFDIVELWSDDENGKLHCTYVQATESLAQVYPNIITGHYPNHKAEHKLSPRLCGMARDSGCRYHWRVIEEQDEANSKVDSQHPSPLHPELHAPLKTEMSYWVDGETSGCNVFIVGFALRRIPFTAPKLKFLSGVGYAIYVAAFDLDDHEHDDESGAVELDKKVFLPKPLTEKVAAMSSSHSGTEFKDNNALEAYNANFWTFPPPADPQSNPQHVIGVHSPSSAQIKETSGRNMSSVILESTTATNSHHSASDTTKSSDRSRCNPPCWSPVESFNFPVSEIKVSTRARNDLILDDFTDLMHIADGSNSNIYLGILNGERVIVKMIKESAEHDSVALLEFDIEHGMLSRLSHPNIISLLGAGRFPRRFIVLEWLGGGTLNSILQEHQVKPGITKRMFRKPSFTYKNLLSKARDIALAFDYLHKNCHPGATIIHRDLKPDNIGFTKDGALKLLDFGLCTVVKKRKQTDEAYEMTGNTGSLRYMAPEVALRRPYTEKVDVYSFGIMVWQMARDQVPYKGMNKADFMNKVALRGERPKPDKSWPVAFTSLLEACWHADPKQRPAFDVIAFDLERLLAPQPSIWPRLTPHSNYNQTNNNNTTNSSNTVEGKAVTPPTQSSGSNRQSSWF